MLRRLYVRGGSLSTPCINPCVQGVARRRGAHPHQQHSPHISWSSSTAARSLAEAKEQGTGFDLSVAVALAAAAFEAYLEPTGAEGYQDRAPNGTETTYTDRVFLSSRYQGLLQLTVHSAEGLAAVNLTGDTSDPYVVAAVGDSCRVTPVVWGNINPVWDVTIPLYIRDAAADVVQLQVLDKGKMRADQPLGAATIPVAYLTQAAAAAAGAAPAAAAAADGQPEEKPQQELQHHSGNKDHSCTLNATTHDGAKTTQRDISSQGCRSGLQQQQQQEEEEEEGQEQQQEEQAPRGRGRIGVPLEGGPGHITISASWLPFDEPGRLERVLAADKDLPPPPAELVAVGAAVAAVTCLPLQAADQLKEVAEQVQEASQLLQHQTQEVAEVLQPVLTTAARAVETLQPLVANAVSTLADTATAAAEAAAAVLEEGKDTQSSLTPLGSLEPAAALHETAPGTPAAAAVEGSQPRQGEQQHHNHHHNHQPPKQQQCSNMDQDQTETLLQLEDHCSISMSSGSSMASTRDKQWSSVLFEDAASGSSSRSLSSSASLSSSDEEVELGEVVGAAREQVLQVLDQGVTGLQQQLLAAGWDDTATALGPMKEAAAAQVDSAATSVTSYVTRKGLGALPVSDLSKLLASVQRLQQEKRELQESAAKAAAAQAATFASRGPLDSLTATGGMEELLLQADVSAAAVGYAKDQHTLTPEMMPSAWRALTKVAGKMVDDLFTPVAYLDNPGSDTQVWVQVSRPLREVVVAFRGTEQVKWKDLAADLNLIPTSLDHGDSSDQVHLGPIPLPLATFKKNKEVMVHSGFLAAYNCVKDQVLSLVDALTKGASPGDPWVIWVTGHSLGGSLATLCAYELAGRRPAKSGAHRVIMYTYGAPRCGNKAFADAFDDRLGAVGAAWRITNIRDIVPTVPRLMGYAHVGQSVRLTGGGGLLMGAEAEGDVLVEGREVLEVLGELASKAMKVAAGAAHPDTLMTPFQQHEMAVLNSLVDGSALEQHMEDFYLLTLKDCVLAAAPELRPCVEEALAAAVAEAAEQAAAAAAATAAQG